MENVWRRYFCQSPAGIINTSIITISLEIRPWLTLHTADRRVMWGPAGWPAAADWISHRLSWQGQTYQTQHQQLMRKLETSRPFLDFNWNICRSRRPHSVCEPDINNTSVITVRIFAANTSPGPSGPTMVLSVLMKALVVTFSQDLNAPNGWL